MSLITLSKVAAWVVGGLFLLGICGVVILYVLAGLAMAGNSRAIEKEAAKRAAAFKALPVEDHLRAAKVAIDAKDFPTAWHHLSDVSRDAPGAEALIERCRQEEDAWEKAKKAAPLSAPTREVAR